MTIIEVVVFFILLQSTETTTLLANFKVTPKLLAFIQAVAAGEVQHKAYREHYATRKNIELATAKTQSSLLLRKSKVIQLLEQAKKAREVAIFKASANKQAREFIVNNLTTDELDLFHVAVIRGLVEVEEILQVYSWEDVLDKKGNVIRRVRIPTIERIKRPPNIREKQVSVDALYRRRAAYPPQRFALTDTEGGEVENVKRVVLLPDGTKITLF